MKLGESKMYQWIHPIYDGRYMIEGAIRRTYTDGNRRALLLFRTLARTYLFRRRTLATTPRNTGDDAKPPQNTRQNAADADTIDFTSTVQKDSPVPAVKDDRAPNSISWSYLEALM